MSGILTTLCGGLVLIAGWQYRHRLAGLLGLLMVLLPWFFDSKLQAMLSYAELCVECLTSISECVTRVYLSCFWDRFKKTSDLSPLPALCAGFFISAFSCSWALLPK
ncbi:hypothetical protein, partial [Aeromonas salmonicida]